MRERSAHLDSPGDSRHQFDALGVARVRALLLDELAEPAPGWRREARQWLDERLRAQGQVAFRGVLAAIALALAAIVALAWWHW